MADFLKDNIFPYSELRGIQKDLIEHISLALREKKNLLVHAPTGIGKTAATIAPALSYALKNELTIFFLTSRHTQHKIAIDTLSEIKKKYDINFTVTDIIGKKHMCITPGIESINSGDFNEYCKNARENNQCEFYTNSFKNSKPTPKLHFLIDKLKNMGPAHVEKIIDLCIEEKICPYYLSSFFAQKSNVIVTDYYYLFSEGIREIFFKKAEKTLSDAIVIVDEGHNLPDRLRSLMTSKLTMFGIDRALKEAKKYKLNETYSRIEKIQEIFSDWLIELKKLNIFERLVAKEELIDEINEVEDIEDVIADFEFVASGIREEKKQSYIGALAKFLELWQGEDKGFVRILSFKKFRDKTNLVLSYNCLDPSLITKTTLANAHSVILMSGTLTPLLMYRDVLGFSEDSFMQEYSSPFPEENRLNMIIPDTTTKYSERNDDQFKKIAKICSDVTNEIPGNCAIFFPSYDLRNQVNNHYQYLSKKTLFLEDSLMSKAEKTEFLEKFKKYNNAVLLGVAGANFSEGIDLPGILKCVIVVGLPLPRPDLETKELIKYYDNKFGKGWDYGYIYPALNKTIQAAGRCIRSEKDKGVIVFLDERYSWDSYLRCFPKDWNFKITKLYLDKIHKFFKK